jgi:hypothetical protein
MRSRIELNVHLAILLGVVGLLFVWPLIAAAMFITWMIYIASAAHYYQNRLGRDLERDLGFRLGAYVPRIGLLGPRRILAIRDVHPDGIFARVGFREWDLVPNSSFTEFFRMLHRYRGRSVELTVIDGSADIPMAERPRRVIQFVVPAAARAEPKNLTVDDAE